jgi:tRNA modification GTPase
MVGDKPVLKISVKENLGIEDLKDTIAQIFFKGELKSRNNTMITNIRHRDALKKAKENLVDAIKTIDAGMPLDCISIDIKEAWNRIGEITGETVKEDILNEIFRRFCIGK